MITVEDYISGLQCKKVDIGDQSILGKLNNFDCGCPDKRTTHVSEAMLQRLKDYILQDQEHPTIHDLYYIIFDKEDIFLFFSLQASSIFSTQQAFPNDINQLKFAFDSAMEMEKTGYRDIPEPNDFRIAMGSLEDFAFLDLKSYLERNDEELTTLMHSISKIITIKKSEKQNNIYVDKIIPSIELVNFCKNHKAEQKWFREGFRPALVPALFWHKVLPIISNVSQEIGCVYVVIFAADVSDEKKDERRKLLYYYENAYSFKEDENLCALKPRYDWECIFLCQKIKKLVEKSEQFKRDYLSNPSEDDV